MEESPTTSIESAHSPSSNARQLAATGLRNDPRIAQAKALLVAALEEHAATVCEVRPPQEDLSRGYQELLTRLGHARGGTPVFPYLAAGLGHGPWVELGDGSVKLDFIGGIGVHGLGHSDPRMLAAGIDAALEDTVMQGNLQQHPPSLYFCERLLALARGSGAPLEHCLLTTSGAMANENALKLALYHRYPADRVLAFENAFAGRSLAMAALTDRAKYRDRLPLTIDVDYLPFLDPADPAGSTQRALDRLQQYLERYPQRYAAFWAEAVTGEGGYYAGSHDFFAPLCSLLRNKGIPIIMDEVQTFGRLSRPFAFQHFELDPYVDIVTVGKITQVCATLYRTEMKPQSPILSQTFTGASSSIACGLAVLDAFESSHCFGPSGSNMRLHAEFVQRLEQLGKEFPGLVRGPYGCGMMLAWTPADGSAETAKWIVDTMYAEGLIGFICGSDPTRVRFLPPPCATAVEHFDVACEVMRRTLKRFQEEKNQRE